MKSLIKWLGLMPLLFGMAILGAGCGDTGMDDGAAPDDTVVSTEDATVTTDDAGDVTVDVEEPTPDATAPADADVTIETDSTEPAPTP